MSNISIAKLHNRLMLCVGQFFVNLPFTAMQLSDCETAIDFR